MSGFEGRILVLSDTHLGKPRGGAGSAEALRPLWQGAQHLIINGDVAEVNDASLRTEAARQVLLIQQMCEADGVELTLLSGNHDPLLSDQRHLELCDGQVYLTHGDALHPAISPWTGHRDRLRLLNQRTHDALSEDERASTAGHLAAAQYASLFTWDELTRHPEDHRFTRPRWCLEKAKQVARVLWYWHTLPYAAARFAGKHAPTARFFIFGHIHRAGVWRMRGRVIINTGAFGFPFRPRAVVIERNRLTVWPVVQDAESQTYQLAGRDLARFDIPRRAA
ncbi:MAG: hypothetical protein Kow00105_00370 [Phycisphaeraceae bacterium]